MSTHSRSARLVPRIGLIALAALLAIACVTSSVLAGMVGLITVIAVLIDTRLVARPGDSPGVAEPLGIEHPANTAQERISVDLSRRP